MTSGSGDGVGLGANYNKVFPDESFSNQYYTVEEYQALNDAQNKGIKLKRASRRHNPKLKHGHTPSGGGNKLKMELSKRSIAALVSALASQAGDTESTDPTSDTESKDGEVPMKSAKRQKSNRTNKALLLRKNSLFSLLGNRGLVPSRWFTDRRCIAALRAVATIQTTSLGDLTARTRQTECRSKLDNHADTCMVGTKTALLIRDYNRPVQVHRYYEGVGEMKVCWTVSALIVYDHPESGDMYMLVLRQAILIPQM